MNAKRPLVMILGLTAAAAACAGPSGVAAGETRAKVISSTPVIEQVAVPREVCRNVVEAVPQRGSGAGAVLGAIVGAMAGHGVGGGSGKVATTGIGLIAGAAIGDHIEGRMQPAQARTVRQCEQRAAYESRVVGYEVVYEYAGQRYQTRMQDKPGRTIPVDVTVAPTGYDRDDDDDRYGAPRVYGPQPMAGAPVVIQGAPVVVAQPYVVEPAPVVVRARAGWGDGDGEHRHRHHHHHHDRDWY